ncbi:MAG: hypothetical protein DRI57_16720 [Deltaproteobacteria bacterium]|nr:MAG: hypothetical protein DRI57_16720 [Deltaproteobacteria bacterium]
MNADGGVIRVHPCSSAVCESCFPGKKSRETFGQVLMNPVRQALPGLRASDPTVGAGNLFVQVLMEKAI